MMASRSILSTLTMLPSHMWHREYVLAGRLQPIIAPMVAVAFPSFNSQFASGIAGGTLFTTSQRPSLIKSN